jgi:hypothetical protein
MTTINDSNPITPQYDATAAPAKKEQPASPYKVQAINLLAGAVIGGLAAFLCASNSCAGRVAVIQKQLTIAQLTDQARIQFADNPYRDAIMQEIQTTLPHVIDAKDYTLDNRCVGFNNDEERRKHHAIQDALDSFLSRKDLFKDLHLWISESCIVNLTANG